MSRRFPADRVQQEQPVENVFQSQDRAVGYRLVPVPPQGASVATACRGKLPDRAHRTLGIAGVADSPVERTIQEQRLVDGSGQMLAYYTGPGPPDGRPQTAVDL